ncbi:DNA-binding transcriptional LysR family regulator [Mesorhizobium sp. USDA 4775]|uniref:Regulatory helix-turn-helix protein, lysR family n=1 Tax=Mesorhizobium qingshengii TaxID=1165689 RepID=A0A1G5ZYE9_9HYPH|nr:regulatory helix-turn-helix protein, lysR family [Mesorhizobium qingshengii]
MHFKQLDLKLLVVLDAPLAEGNLSAAARRTNLSKPATSAAVAWLREFSAMNYSA